MSEDGAAPGRERKVEDFGQKAQGRAPFVTWLRVTNSSLLLLL
jgi:hypothetical protein